MAVADRACRILQGAGAGPPPPLAGALSAWLTRSGWSVCVVDPRGAEAIRAIRDDGRPLWVHREGGDDGAPLPQLDPSPGLRWDACRFFGPGLDNPARASRLLAHYPGSVAVLGDPEPSATRIDDLSELPITTYAGFGDLDGGLFRLLAGRGDRVRPVAHVLRELVYLVESHGAGHLLFDDADLGAYGAWLDGFREELRHLPWRISWEGTVAGMRVAGPSGQDEPER